MTFVNSPTNSANRLNRFVPTREGQDIVIGSLPFDPINNDPREAFGKTVEELLGHDPFGVIKGNDWAESERAVVINGHSSMLKVSSKIRCLVETGEGEKGANPNGMDAVTCTFELKDPKTEIIYEVEYFFYRSTQGEKECWRCFAIDTKCISDQDSKDHFYAADNNFDGKADTIAGTFEKIFKWLPALKEKVSATGRKADGILLKDAPESFHRFYDGNVSQAFLLKYTQSGYGGQTMEPGALDADMVGGHLGFSALAHQSALKQNLPADSQAFKAEIAGLFKQTKEPTNRLTNTAPFDSKSFTQSYKALLFGDLDKQTAEAILYTLQTEYSDLQQHFALLQVKGSYNIYYYGLKSFTDAAAIVQKFLGRSYKVPVDIQNKTGTSMHAFSCNGAGIVHPNETAVTGDDNDPKWWKLVDKERKDDRGEHETEVTNWHGELEGAPVANKETDVTGHQQSDAIGISQSSVSDPDLIKNSHKIQLLVTGSEVNADAVVEVLQRERPGLQFGWMLVEGKYKIFCYGFAEKGAAGAAKNTHFDTTLVLSVPKQVQDTTGAQIHDFKIEQAFLVGPSQ